MNPLQDKILSMISGYGINKDDADVLLSLVPVEKDYKVIIEYPKRIEGVMRMFNDTVIVHAYTENEVRLKVERAYGNEAWIIEWE
jgi:hypothetical protein